MIQKSVADPGTSPVFPDRERHLLVITDGLAEPLSDTTTLVRSNTPALDRLASAGRLFRIDPQDGMPADRTSSERGIARLLGVPEKEISRISRASVLSSLLDLTPPLPQGPAGGAGWFFLATPVLLDRNGCLVRYVNDPENERAFWTDLMNRCQEDPSFQFLPVPGTDGRLDRVLLGLPGCPEKGAGGGSPPRSGLAASSGGFCEGFQEWTQRIFGQSDPLGSWKPDDPARAINGIWLWGGGPPLLAGVEIPPSMMSGRPNRSMVAAAPLAKGLGRWMGYTVRPLHRSTGDIDTDLGEKMDAVFAAFSAGAESVVLHLEGFDMASHRKDQPSKIRFLERMDREILRPLLEALNSGRLTSIQITSDHQSSPVSGNHESGPVPAILVFRPDPGEGMHSVSPVRVAGTGTLRRMTEVEAWRSAVVSVEEWNLMPGRRSVSSTENFGKDLCHALS